MKHRLQRATLTIIAIVILCIGTAATGTSPAGASGTDPRGAAASGCLLQNIVLYEDADFGGGCYRFASNLLNFNGHHWSNGRNLDNAASSVENFTGSNVELWNSGGTSCGGANYLSLAHSQDQSLRNNNFNDLASCLKYF